MPFSAMDPKFFPSERLFDWLSRPRIPLMASSDKLTNVFISAMLTGETVKLIYLGGSYPGELRLVKVSLVFQHESGDGFTYQGTVWARVPTGFLHWIQLWQSVGGIREEGIGGAA